MIRAALALVACLTLSGCASLSPIPPGWREPVYPLLLGEADFPAGWVAGSALPENAKDSSANHVGVEWVNDQGGLVMESIWRAFSVSDAQQKYDELLHTRFGPSRTLEPDVRFVPFAPPAEIAFTGQQADEFYTACGWLESYSCVTIGRYHNYVVALTADMRGAYGGYQQEKGLAYAELEGLIRKVDATLGEYVALLGNQK